MLQMHQENVHKKVMSQSIRLRSDSIMTRTKIGIVWQSGSQHLQLCLNTFWLGSQAIHQCLQSTVTHHYNIQVQCIQGGPFACPTLKVKNKFVTLCHVCLYILHKSRDYIVTKIHINYRRNSHHVIVDRAGRQMGVRGRSGGEWTSRLLTAVTETVATPAWWQWPGSWKAARQQPQSR